jgi:hypothetical protein
MRNDRDHCGYIEDTAGVSMTRPSVRGVARPKAPGRLDSSVSSPRPRDARQLLFIQPALPLFAARPAGGSMNASGEAEKPRLSKYPEEF